LQWEKLENEQTIISALYLFWQFSIPHICCELNGHNDEHDEYKQ
jgi:hypothetical protein